MPPVRRRGSGLLILALVGAAVVGVTSLSLAKVNSVAVGSMKANNIALQAYQYADAEAQLVRATAYNDLSAKAKADIQNSNGFQSEITLSAESNYSDTIKQKTATVKIYRSGESTPRIALNVKRLSKESNASSVPSGTILPWYGDPNSIPSGFALCNGSNGTPDLRDRFLVGAGSSYNRGATGGANTVTLNTNQIPSHAHSRGTMNITGSAQVGSEWHWGWTTDISSGSLYTRYTTAGVRNEGGASDKYKIMLYFDASRNWTGVTSYVGGSQSHENRPPYYAVYYIMKL